MTMQSTPARPTPGPAEQNSPDPRSSTPGAPAVPPADPGALRAAHTPNFPALLRQLGASLLPRRVPDLINDDEKLLESSFVVATVCLGEVAASKG